MQPIENRVFDAIAPGEAASVTHTLTYKDMQTFSTMARHMCPAAIDEAAARSEPFHDVAAQGMWLPALISALVATRLPGLGSKYAAQSLHFERAIALGDTMTVTLTVTAKDARDGIVGMDCLATNQRGEIVARGRAEIIAPTEKISRLRETGSDQLSSGKGRRYERLIALTRGLAPIRTAVIYPVETISLLGAMEAARANLIEPILIGPEDRIRAEAVRAQVDVSGYEIVPADRPEEAAQAAVRLAREARAEALMKGALHTDVLLRAVLDRDHGLRTERRLSHVFAIDAPFYPRPILLTDAAVNIDPTLSDKRDIVQNAIALAHALGIPCPRVAILSAVETVTEALRSTLDAAALCKMAERGQITGGILDGPLAFDNAVSVMAAKAKGIVSPVAGHADIFVVPDLEAGNMLAKELEYLADAQMAGIALGARVPIILTSRADRTLARLGSCAIALLLVRHAGEKT
ncbi:bifunctional enoyl-CoA hydratase/phosphate acetyltransferase [Nguyenibacter vanlangensis]|uniref:Bifunctional enoyl-CoA hydratase/phosphate acetyltransferase n=2 Tax=Nguyenibacter vanlangensis TaxID=1216886 RepID=A0A7Y7ITE7_9PROT|nr:bifunctional enoyl-CoA hydratase/phosphate acetyltransferase [Nguyenibacter vanlangensis]